MHAWDQPAETLLALGPKAGAQLVMPRLGEPVEPAHAEARRAVVARRRHDRAEPEPDTPAAITLAEGHALADRLGL